MLINKSKSVGLKYYDDAKSCIEYSYDRDDIYENNKEYDSNKRHKMLIVINDIIADMLSNKNFNW